MREICIRHRVCQGKVKIGCDSDSYLKAAGDRYDSLPISHPKADARRIIIHVNRRLEGKFRVEITW